MSLQLINIRSLSCTNYHLSTVPDPGFPAGMHGPLWRGGAWTPGAVTFRKFCMFVCPPRSADDLYIITKPKQSKN